jgi:hypothetical protein
MSSALFPIASSHPSISSIPAFLNNSSILQFFLTSDI